MERIFTKSKMKLFITVLLLGALGQAKAWTGNALKDVAGESNLYLYNVGTGKFMTNDGIWGTQAVLTNNVGLPFTLKTVTDGSVYNISTAINNPSAGNYLNFSDGNNLDKNSAGYFFVDQPNTYGFINSSRFTFSEVSEGSNIFTIKVTSDSGDENHTGTFYLSANDKFEIEGKNTSDITDNEKWMIVTLAQIEANFNQTEGTNAKPATAGFKIKDNGFKRLDSDISNWKYEGMAWESVNEMKNNSRFYNGEQAGEWADVPRDKTNPTIYPSDAYNVLIYTYDVQCQYKYGNRYYSFHTYTIKSTEDYGATKTITSDFIDCGHSDEHKNYDLARQIITKKSSHLGYQYYVGNGNGEGKLNGKDGGEYHQENYGGKWTANIHGAEGRIYQDITIDRKGWWLVSCKGLSTDGTGYLFASVNNATTGDGYAYVPFVSVENVPDTYVEANEVLTGMESQSVLVYVKKGETLRIGAYVKGGSDTSWTCFDNFDIAYCGDIVEDLRLILDENQTSIDYINNQVNTDKAQILYLNRHFTKGKWNSIVLPVNLTVQQVKTAFGGGTKLSALNRTGSNGKQIFFEPVSLSDNDNSKPAIVAGQLYIIKPQVDETVGEVVKNIGGTDITIEKYYLINQVTLAEEIASPDVYGDVIGSVEDNGIQHVGTYVWKKENAIPADTYILSGGKWYYNKVVVNQCKGFRGWLETDKNKDTYSISINGILDYEASGTTSIEGIDAGVSNVSEGVFNFNGQQVRGTSSLEGLARGIYIVGGKKVIVK